MARGGPIKGLPAGSPGDAGEGHGYICYDAIAVRMPRPDEPKRRVLGRFHGRAEQLGLQAPKATLRLKLLRTADAGCWTLFVQTLGAESVPEAVRWLQLTSPLRLEFGSRNIVRADYDPLPAEVARAFAGVEMQFTRLEPNGDAVISVVGTRGGVAAFARRLYGPKAPLELVQLRGAEPPVRLLTTPQDDALRAAVAAGYYRIPRALNLEELARKLGITSGSLSERLRRAEGRIITRYVEAGGASPWDEKTLFDVRPLHADVAEEELFPPEPEVKE